MSGGKLSPRQKMINMMYLVLTALLALNVQKSVLDAFAIINETLDKTIDTFINKNALVYDEFAKQMAQNPDKVRQWKRKADEVHSKADIMDKYIHDLKIKLVMRVDAPETIEEKLDSLGRHVNAKAIDGKDNLDIGGEIMIVDGEGKKVQQEIIAYRDYLVSLIKPKDEDIKVSVLKTLDVRPPAFDAELGSVSWESMLFEHLPFIAVVANLTQLQSASRYAESEVIAYLKREVTGDDIPFNKVEGIVIPKSNYVTKGDSFLADIFLAAFDSLNAPQVYVGEFDEATMDMKSPYDSLRVVNGKGKLRRSAYAVGTQNFKGIIELKTKSGSRKYPFGGEYEVAEPNIVVSPTKMNVFYIGVDNPTECSVSGYSAEKVFPTLVGAGSIRKDSKGGYIVTVTKPGSCNVEVSVEMVPGKKKSMGKKEFRAKSLPTPVLSYVSKKGEAALSKGAIKANEYFVAQMENFDFDVKVLVSEFDMIFTQSGLLKTLKSKNNKRTAEMNSAVDKLKKGDRVFVEGAKARLPDGTIRDLSPMVIKVI